MAKFAQMEQELDNQQTEHKEQIYQLERKQVVDKDRWVDVIWLVEVGNRWSIKTEG